MKSTYMCFLKDFKENRPRLALILRLTAIVGIDMIYIENNTWVRGNTRFISCSTREINLVFPSTHVFFCLLYKGQSLKSDNFYRKAIIEKR